MNFVLVLVTSSAPWFPTNVTTTAFDTKSHCEQALIEAKKEWSTVNADSKCIDLDKEAAIKDAEDNLNALRKNK